MYYNDQNNTFLKNFFHVFYIKREHIINCHASFLNLPLIKYNLVI